MDAGAGHAFSAGTSSGLDWTNDTSSFTRDDAGWTIVNGAHFSSPDAFNCYGTTITPFIKVCGPVSYIFTAGGIWSGSSIIQCCVKRFEIVIICTCSNRCS